MSSRRSAPLVAAGLAAAVLLPGPAAAASEPAADGTADPGAPPPAAAAPAPPGGPQPDPADLDACTGTSPVVCHYDVPPGRYDVTVLLGDARRAGSTAVLAEARRSLLPETATAPGEALRRTFTVDVRDPEGEPTRTDVGTPGLTLTFTGSRPRVAGVDVASARRHRTVHLAGDSTVCDQAVAPYTGWGQVLPRLFGRGTAVANRADSGESSGSFLADPRLFDAMRPLIRPNDLVLVQFGHNDKQTAAEDFRAHLARLVEGVRERGGRPVLVTPAVRRIFDGQGRLTPVARHVNGLGVDLPAEMRRTARTLDVPLVDLTEDSRALVEELGPERSKDLYLYREKRDNTHFSEYGAARIAELVHARLNDPRVVPGAHRGTGWWRR